MRHAQPGRLVLGLVGLLLCGLFAAFAAAPAQAQERRRLVLGEFEVEGKVQKPEITIFITRQNLDTEFKLELKESFIPRIVESVEKKPF
jgi:hypothetical protein